MATLNEKLTTFKDGNDGETGTPARGSTFDKEFNRLYENDTLINNEVANVTTYVNEVDHNIGENHTYFQQKITEALKYISTTPHEQCLIFYGGNISFNDDSTINISEGAGISTDLNDNSIKLLYMPALENVPIPEGWDDGRQVWIVGKYDAINTLEDSYAGSQDYNELFTDVNPETTAICWASFTLLHDEFQLQDGRTNVLGLSINGESFIRSLQVNDFSWKKRFKVDDSVSLEKYDVVEYQNGSIKRYASNDTIDSTIIDSTNPAEMEVYTLYDDNGNALLLAENYSSSKTSYFYLAKITNNKIIIDSSSKISFGGYIRYTSFFLLEKNKILFTYNVYPDDPHYARIITIEDSTIILHAAISIESSILRAASKMCMPTENKVACQYQCIDNQGRVLVLSINGNEIVAHEKYFYDCDRDVGNDICYIKERDQYLLSYYYESSRHLVLLNEDNSFEAIAEISYGDSCTSTFGDHCLAPIDSNKVLSINPVGDTIIISLSGDEISVSEMLYKCDESTMSLFPISKNKFVTINSLSYIQILYYSDDKIIGGQKHQFYNGSSSYCASSRYLNSNKILRIYKNGTTLASPNKYVFIDIQEDLSNIIGISMEDNKNNPLIALDGIISIEGIKEGYEYYITNNGKLMEVDPNIPIVVRDIKLTQQYRIGIGVENNKLFFLRSRM